MASPPAVPRLPPHDTRTPALSVVDMHTGGEPLRIVLAGCPEVVGPTLLAKQRYMRQHLDHVRRRLMFEPRGHRDMYGAVLVPSELPDAHLGVLFLHNEGYSSMCGHAVLALGRFALDFGLVPAPPAGAREALVNIHCPCGLVAAFVECEGGRSGGPVRFHSVPAFALATDLLVDVPGHGKVVVDIAYGGAFYAFVSAEKLGLDVCSTKTRDLMDAASAVTEAVKSQFKINHPDSEDLAFLYGTILTDGKDAYSEEPTTNICVFADEQVDRSPTGSGVTARIALQYYKGLLELNQTRAFKSSATGSVFTGKAVRVSGTLSFSFEVKCGDFKAVIVEVSGQAHYTGTANFIVEDDDPLRDGFLLK
ncbi:trans-3-hydroxy-L-proline dehydratase isoform X1 [Lagenorhynchus albirostris]|uniref:trans-3-hydroxy-L-proline dehydratase isoform X1 n=1 Tax=Lagenorhynchus albirostris TaxID=27610 RepID=UPI0028E9A245|nr:trans-3-hydroxy-L-proline dehydratase isoform X1 [Lagenorhynchus albirostris]